MYFLTFLVKIQIVAFLSEILEIVKVFCYQTPRSGILPKYRSLGNPINYVAIYQKWQLSLNQFMYVRSKVPIRSYVKVH